MDFEEIKGLKIMPVTQCGAMGKMYSSPSQFEHRMPARYSGKHNVAAIAAFALARLEEARTEDVKNHEANVSALANNARIVAAVKELMSSIGLPTRFSQRDINSRARIPKTITQDAGYLTDLCREVRTSDGFEGATATYERLLPVYKEYAAQAEKIAEQERAAAERAKQAEIDKRKADMELATLLLRYSLPIESDWDDVLDALCEKDARLNLAVTMNLCRNDWNDGCGSVLGAVRGISIQTDEDKEIVADILACCEDFEDGRVFRDTAWNYGRLFAEAADQSLAVDVQLAMERADARRYG